MEITTLLTGFKRPGMLDLVFSLDRLSNSSRQAVQTYAALKTIYFDACGCI